MKVRRDLALSLAWLVPFLIYAFSCYHDVGFWDVGEMDTVPWILGIAHPTGFPAFVMIAWLFTHVVAIGTVAYRMSLLSALSLSLAAWLVARTVDEACEQPWIAMGCAWVFAFGDITWARATRAEVHAFATLAIAATLFCAIHWFRTGDRRYFIGGAIAWAFGIGTHPVAVLILPGMVLLLVAGLWRTRTPWKTVALAVAIGVVIVGACYAYLPLRSAYVTAHRLDPTRAIGLPPGEAFWDYDHPATRTGFQTLVSGSDFDVGGGLQAIVQPGTYLQGGKPYLETLWRQFTIVGVGLLLLGIVAGLVRSPWIMAGLVLAGFASVSFALGYYEEADSERYYLTSLFICSVCIGYGSVWLAEQWRVMRVVMPAALIVIAGYLVYSGGENFFYQPHDDRAVATITNILHSTPPDAIIVAPWTYATPLAYAAYVEHTLQNRTLVAAWISERATYVPYWAEHRPVYVLDTLDAQIPGYRYEIVAHNPDVYVVVKK